LEGWDDRIQFEAKPGKKNQWDTVLKTLSVAVYICNPS
jgi:hypothetical protein